MGRGITSTYRDFAVSALNVDDSAGNVAEVDDGQPGLELNGDVSVVEIVRHVEGSCRVQGGEQRCAEGGLAERRCPIGALAFIL